MNGTLIRYCRLLGVHYGMETFEGGYVITLQSTTGEREVRHTYYDGDPVVPFEERILRWLHQQPWPNEDDPRVQHEGAFA